MSDCPRPFVEWTPSMLVSGLATSPPSRKQCTGPGATLGPSVVAPGDKERDVNSFSGWSPSRPSIGYRELPDKRCPQHTSSVHPSPRGLSYPAGAEAIAPTFPGQLRGGKAGSVPGSQLTPRDTPQKPKSSLSIRLSSQKPSSTTTLRDLQQQCPAGFEVYQKKVEEKKAEDNWRERRRRRKEASGECKSVEN